jgi:hypothetical protein
MIVPQSPHDSKKFPSLTSDEATKGVHVKYHIDKQTSPPQIQHGPSTYDTYSESRPIYG